MFDRRVLLGVILIFLGNIASAETMYVTDRILLGVHEAPQEDSVLLKSIVSGTAVDVVSSQGTFSKIKLPDGTEGWVTSGFLKQEQPAVAALDAMHKKYDESTKSLKELNDELKKKERELQIRRDELSNATTTIKEMKKQMAAKGTLPAVDETKYKQAEDKIATLTKQLAEMTAAKEAAEKTMKGMGSTDIKTLQEENNDLQARIASAKANLNGDTVPTPEQLAAIRPDFPVWYWGLILLVFVIGLIVGLQWMDHRNRMRHGGFRI